eukprot:gene8414-10332_t
MIVKRSTTFLLFLYLSNVIFVNCVIKVDVKTQFFVDEYGRTRLFHGLNAVYKIPPYHPTMGDFDPNNSLGPEDIANLQSWGFNAIRLGVMWPGVEPSRDQINQTYLDTMSLLVNQLGNAGIYTIVDFHQDILNRRFCGEGIPDWAVELKPNAPQFPEPIVKPSYPVDPDTLYPNISQCLNKEFGIYYFSADVNSGFQSLYDNVNGIRDELIQYWTTLAQTFKNTQSVLGYEIINEPWGGDIYESWKYLLDFGYADSQNLYPLYQDVNTAIREIDNEHCIFFEKSLVDLYESYFPAGTPGGIDYNDRQVYSYHIYCATDRNGSPRHEYICDTENNIFFNGAMKDLAKLGGGGFMTEFGAVSNSTNSLEMLDFMTSEADKYLQSWTYWQFKYYNDITTAGSTESLYNQDGSLDVAKLKTLSRTYAQAIAGNPQSMVFDPQTASFQLVFNVDTSITQPTIIYLNEDLYYPNGYQAQITSGVATIQSPQTNILYVNPTSSTPNGSQITVSIKAK